MITRRPRRNRSSEAIRSMVRETELNTSHLVFPLFTVDATNVKSEIASLPGVFRYSPDNILREIESCLKYGLDKFMIFPAIDEKLKDKVASHSYSEKNFYLQLAKSIKKEFPEVCLISDVAMDPYSVDGHDGLVYNGKIDNDKTLPILAKMSVAQAHAGFDIIGPSDMMDGRIGAIREALDEQGLTETGIMAYTAKYASGLYGPFRDALDSAPKEGADIPKDKKTYQMDPANKQEAITEAILDIEEGADFIMVKPALHYLDVIQLLKSNFETPVAAYHVSGECAMLKAACLNGWLDYEKMMPETLVAIKRAGADVIISYLAKDYAKWKMKA